MIEHPKLTKPIMAARVVPEFWQLARPLSDAIPFASTRARFILPDLKFLKLRKSKKEENLCALFV